MTNSIVEDERRTEASALSSRWAVDEARHGERTVAQLSIFRKKMFRFYVRGCCSPSWPIAPCTFVVTAGLVLACPGHPRRATAKPKI
jgi:hypothetical protein